MVNDLGLNTFEPQICAGSLDIRDVEPQLGWACGHGFPTGLRSAPGFDHQIDAAHIKSGEFFAFAINLKHEFQAQNSAVKMNTFSVIFGVKNKTCSGKFYLSNLQKYHFTGSS